jgi:hypothetical protein
MGPRIMVNFRQMRESSIRAQLGNQPRTAIPRPRVRSIAAIRSLDSSTRTHYCGGCRAEISAALWLERLANSVRKFARACLGISGKATLSRLICPLSRRFVRAAPSAWNLAKTLLISRHEEWRTRRDSNSRPLPSEGMTLDSADDGGAALHGTRPCEAPGVPAPAQPCALRPVHLEPGPSRSIGVGGGFAARTGLVHSPLSPLSSRATWRSPISCRMRQEVSFRCSTAGSWQSSTASSLSIWSSAGADGREAVP